MEYIIDRHSSYGKENNLPSYANLYNEVRSYIPLLSLNDYLA